MTASDLKAKSEGHERDYAYSHLEVNNIRDVGLGRTMKRNDTV